MGKSKNLESKLLFEIEEGRHGTSGSLFLTVREVADQYAVSYVTAQKALQELRREGWLYSVGNHSYLATGTMRRNAPLAKELEQIQSGSRRFGLHISRIDNLFFASMAAQLISTLAEHGWQLIVMSSDDDPATERRILNEFTALGVSGIFTCPGKENVYRNCVLPVVCLGRSVIGGNAVLVNNKSAGMKMAAHFLEQGYQRFLYVGTSALSAEQDYRLIGFREGLAENGILLQPEDIFALRTSSFSKDEHLHLINRRIRTLDGPIGIFCYHDLLAFDILDLCRKNGIDVPQKVGIAGFDDLKAAGHMGHQLTTVSYRYDKMVEKAVDLMLMLLSEPELHKDIYVNQVLTVRESTMLRKNG